MTCKECSHYEICDICKDAELDKLPEWVRFNCYKFKPIEKDGEKQ